MASDQPTPQITHLLRAWSKGDQGALDQLAPMVYKELRRIAFKYMRNERPGNTLQTTALVNEVYLRMVDAASVDWRDRAHFFAVSSQMMRRILVDRARARCAAKRGGPARRVNLDDIPARASSREPEIVALDDALEALAEVDPRKAKVIELRFFGGMEVEEAATVLGVSPQTVMRDWKLGKAWLLRELSQAKDKPVESASLAGRK
jgi:RNA polymerase sigma factor (TIGR02999 family)